MNSGPTHQRILHTDTWDRILIKLSDGNRRALNVLMLLLQNCKAFEFGSPFGVLQIFFALDNAAIFGPLIWQLYKDVCGGDLARFVTVMRASDFEIVSAERLHLECMEPGGLDFDAIRAALIERCPRFRTEVGRS